LDVVTPEPLPADHELLTFKNVCVLPHLGANVTAVKMAKCEMAFQNILCGLKGVEMPAEVN